MNNVIQVNLKTYSEYLPYVGSNIALFPYSRVVKMQRNGG